MKMKISYAHIKVVVPVLEINIYRAQADEAYVYLIYLTEQ